MYDYEIFFFNMQFCLASNKVFRTESILLSHVFTAFSLVGLNYISVSSCHIRGQSCVVMDRHSLDSDMYMAMTASRLVFLFVCFSCLDFPNVLVCVIDNFLILVV